MTYTIYYGTRPNGLPKIGVDSNYPARAKVQKLTDYSRMEEHNDMDVVGAREIELQIQHFGKRDNTLTYRQQVELLEKHRVVFNSESGAIAGRKAINRGTWATGDQAARGRVKSTWRHSLTYDQVNEIKAKYIPKVYSQHKLAKEYGVAQSVISNVINNKNYQA
tara:strand:+ start:35 stop:526 length:492 start_codon:yes stop_codon:yes gene_type:complete